MTTDIRRDVLGRLKTALAIIDDSTADLHEGIAHIGMDGHLLAHEERLNAATADARLQVARLEREIERVEIAEGQNHV